MRFRFCWDCDCPDWLLAEITTLSKITPPALREFSSLICQSISEEQLDYHSVRDVLAETNFDEATIRASVAALRWIYSNAGGVLIEANVLDSELQQLGLPKEQSEAIRNTFQEYKGRLKESARKQTLKASRNVKWSYDIQGLSIGAEKEPILQLHLEGKILNQNKGFTMDGGETEPEKVSVYMTQQQLGSLICELENAYKHMKKLEIE